MSYPLLRSQGILLFLHGMFKLPNSFHGFMGLSALYSNRTQQGWQRGSASSSLSHRSVSSKGFIRPPLQLKPGLHTGSFRFCLLVYRFPPPCRPLRGQCVSKPCRHRSSRCMCVAFAIVCGWPLWWQHGPNIVPKNIKYWSSEKWMKSFNVSLKSSFYNTVFEVNIKVTRFFWSVVLLDPHTKVLYLASVTPKV